MSDAPVSPGASPGTSPGASAGIATRLAGLAGHLDPRGWPLHLWVVPAAMLAGLALVGTFPTWVTLTLAGLAMGMMMFIMASGMTLVFGLMDVLNFGHGAFISLGAFVGVSALAALAGLSGGGTAAQFAAIALAALAAMLATGLFGWLFEKVIVRPVYGNHLKQILITMGGLIVVEQIIQAVWGPDAIPIPRPESLKGAFAFGEVAIEKYRLLAVGLGLVIFVAMGLVLTRTRIGLLVRAGVENGEMVESLGYRIRLLFVLVFIAGSALAGLGGVMWGLYEEIITAHMGANVMILVFIVVIIGGLGSVNGCFVGALLIGLINNYVAYLAPKLSLGSAILVMVVVLMTRPEGLLPATKGR